MFIPLTLALALGLPGEEPAAKAPPMKKELFSAEDWYKGQEGKEQSFEGVLKYKPRDKGVVGFGRYNPFILHMVAGGKPTFREVHVGGKEELLRPYAGKPVRLTGKAVDMEVEGTMHREIWPARLEVLGEGNEKPAAGNGVKVLGRTNWRVPSKPAGGGQQFVVKSDAEFARRLPPGEKPETALENLRKQTQVDVDWNKHMLIVATGGTQRSGGYRVEITDVTREGDVMTVRWRLHTPKAGDLVTMALTHPAEAVLVERFDGKVVFDPPPQQGGRK